MKVMIVGGSIVGLMHGVMFKRRGCDVHIIEQAPRALKAQAAGVATSPYVKQFLALHDRLTSAFSFPSKGVRTVDTQDRIVEQMLLPMEMGSWDNLYLRLRANFDGLSSHVYPNPPPHASGDGQTVYEGGKRLTSIDVGQGNEVVVVRYEDVNDGTTQTMNVDVVIGADGANSSVRSLVNPSAPTRRFAGYVLWRGIVPEQELTAQIAESFGEWISFCPVPQLADLITTYYIPGRDGSLKVGERDMNFAWYSHLKPHELSEALTDTDHHKHRWSVPMGKLSPAVWEKQLHKGKGTISEACSGIASNIKEPFMQVIADYPPSKAMFHEGKVLLVGDACCLMRPHSGAAIGQGALHALSLEKALFHGDDGRDLVADLSNWEREVIYFSHVERLRSISWGEYYVGGWSGWLPAALHYHGLVQWRKWRAKVVNLLGY